MTENHAFDQMLSSLQKHYLDLEGINIDSPSARFNIDSPGNEVLQIPTDEARRFGFRQLHSSVALGIQALN
jgi:hypothetical protein